VLFYLENDFHKKMIFFTVSPNSQQSSRPILPMLTVSGKSSNCQN